MNQAIDKRTSGIAWSRKALGACLMVVGTLLAACLMAAQPAHASTTFTVNDTRDSPDASSTAGGTCDIDVFNDGNQCTLRAAIQQANATLGADTINFNIPGTGVKTIHVNSGGFGELPAITEQVTIDGYTQPLAHPNTLAVGNDASLKIELDGTNAGLSASGLVIQNTSKSVIKGLVINHFQGSGIYVFGDSAVGNRIEGNFIGTDPTGTLDEGNGGDGVFLIQGPSENVVGGTTPAARNLISGNGGSGISVSKGSKSTLIKGNYVGTDKGGTKELGNDDSGVRVGTSLHPGINVGTTVGGTTAASRNVVSGNNRDGIDIFDSEATKVLGNRVGTTASGKGALGNGEDGVTVSVGFGTLIGNGTSGGSNTVAFNGDDGVDIPGIGTNGIEISRNSVFSNAGLGIDLTDDGATANDTGDADDGANDLQNKPVLSSAKTVSGTTTIKGKLDSNPGKTYTIEFYSNPADTNEGKKFIGEQSITTSVDGLRSFTFTPTTSVAVGQTITATATTDTTGDPTHDTSEFSAPRTVAAS